FGDRQARRREPRDEQPRDDEGAGGTKHRKQPGLGKFLENETYARRAERTPDGKLVVTSGRTRQHKVRQIRARHDQDQRYERHHERSATAELRVDIPIDLVDGTDGPSARDLL